MTKKQKETVDNAINKMSEIARNDDTEAAHGYADDLLCKVLNAFGCAELVDLYNKVDNWYS